MTFVPKIALRDRSKNDPNRSPRWFKAALATVEQRPDGCLWFQPNRQHPSLAPPADVYLGIPDAPDTLAAMQAAYRSANQVKRLWRRQCETEREERILRLHEAA
jgi:hypothetical protein